MDVQKLESLARRGYGGGARIRPFGSSLLFCVVLIMECYVQYLNVLLRDAGLEDYRDIDLRIATPAPHPPRIVIICIRSTSKFLGHVTATYKSVSFNIEAQKER